MDAESKQRLRRHLDTADDQALVALANRGLVRRAAKDLQQAETPQWEETESAILIRGGNWTVTMPAEGPIAASDDTAATGVTRQILAATMFLRDHWDAAGAADDDARSKTGEPAASESVERPMPAALREAEQRLLEATPGELAKWAGKTPVLEAAAGFRSDVALQIQRAAALSIEFGDAEVRVVLMIDRPAKTLRRLLDQFHTTASRGERARWVLMAVFALQHAAGRPEPSTAGIAAALDPDQQLTEAIRDDRRRVARHCQRLVEAFAAAGVAHPSSRIVERFQTTAITAEAAKFPRLARLAQSIAEDCELQIQRHASAELQRRQQRLIVTHALAQAASRPENASRPDLFGRQRTNYQPAGELRLDGLGAYGWQTDSGYEGLTTVFWDAEHSRFVTASTSRPQGQDRNFSIHQAYRSGVGWSGPAPVEELCRSRLVLHDAKLNADGRLSASETCRVTLQDRSDPLAIDFGEHQIDRWSGVAHIARKSQPLGLRVPRPLDALVLLKPAEWGERWFDELDQELVWPLVDGDGERIELRVPWTAVDESAVMFLEAVRPQRDHLAAVLGRLSAKAGRLQVYPLTLISRGTPRGDFVLCPQFDQARIRSRNENLLRRLRNKFGREPVVKTSIGAGSGAQWDAEQDLQIGSLPPRLRATLIELEEVLAAALESGAASFHPAAVETLRSQVATWQSLGMTPLAASLEALTGDSADMPRKILDSAYRLHLTKQALALSQLG